ncbi:unnamed protein product [Pedinophyceae sp. YPF-701]|nr:unnamed protein product [Pedinophyceae sp. YPF-701]
MVSRSTFTSTLPQLDKDHRHQMSEIEIYVQAARDAHARNREGSRCPWLVQVLAHPATYAAVAALAVFMCFLDVVLGEAVQPMPGVGDEWGAAAGAITLMLALTATHVAAGLLCDVPELRQLLPNLVDLIPVICFFTWPAVYNERFETGSSFAAPLGREEAAGHFDDIDRVRAVVRYLLLPSAFLRVVVAAWRHRVLASRVAQARDDKHAPNSSRWSQILMAVTALSVLGVLAVVTIVGVISSQGQADISEADGGATGRFTHVYIEGVLVLTRSRAAPGDPLSPDYGPGVWITNDPEPGLPSVVGRADFNSLHEPHRAETTVRKILLLALCSGLLACNFYLASRMMIGPMQDLLSELLSTAQLLTDSAAVPVGPPRSDAQGKPSLGIGTTIESALSYILEFITIMAKAFEGGRMVFQRLMDQAMEAGDDVDVAAGGKNWAAMFSSTAYGSRDTQLKTASSKPGAAARGKRWLRRGSTATSGVAHSQRSSGALSDSHSLPLAALEWKWSALHVSADKLHAHVVGMFDKLGLLTEEAEASVGRIPRKKLVALLPLVERDYPENPYHNWRHAVDVTHGCFMLLLQSTELDRLLTRRDRLALMLAALGHDMGHKGTNNAFLVSTRDPLAIRYNDQSVQENMHAARLFTTMIEHKEADVLEGLELDEWSRVRSLVVEAIMGTDMARHFDIIAGLEARAEAARLVRERDAVLESEAGDVRLSDKDRKLLLQSLLHLADLSHMLKDNATNLEWTRRVIAEFFAQGKMEKTLGLPSLPLMQEGETYVPGSQVEFFEFLVRPFVSAMCLWLPSAAPPMSRALLSNFRNWLRMLEADKEAAILAGAVSPADVHTSSNRGTMPDAKEFNSGNEHGDRRPRASMALVRGSVRNPLRRTNTGLRSAASGPTGDVDARIASQNRNEFSSALLRSTMRWKDGGVPIQDAPKYLKLNASARFAAFRDHLRTALTTGRDSTNKGGSRPRGSRPS